MISFISGVVVGFLVGLMIYWMPLGQFINEIKALYNLNKKRYRRGDKIVIASNSDKKSLLQPNLISCNYYDKEYVVFYDRGIDWHFSSKKGWIRARVLSVFDPDDKTGELYNICHIDIKPFKNSKYLK